MTPRPDVVARGLISGFVGPPADVSADHIVAYVRKAGPGEQADVVGAENGYFHEST